MPQNSTARRFFGEFTPEAGKRINTDIAERRNRPTTEEVNRDANRRRVMSQPVKRPSVSIGEEISRGRVTYPGCRGCSYLAPAGNCQGAANRPRNCREGRRLPAEPRLRQAGPKALTSTGNRRLPWRKPALWQRENLRPVHSFRPSVWRKRQAGAWAKARCGGNARSIPKARKVAGFVGTGVYGGRKDRPKPIAVSQAGLTPARRSRERTPTGDNDENTGLRLEQWMKVEVAGTRKAEHGTWEQEGGAMTGPFSMMVYPGCRGCSYLAPAGNCQGAANRPRNCREGEPPFCHSTGRPGKEIAGNNAELMDLTCGSCTEFSHNGGRCQGQAIRLGTENITAFPLCREAAKAVPGSR